jgi:hypothetical protein
MNILTSLIFQDFAVLYCVLSQTQLSVHVEKEKTTVCDCVCHSWPKHILVKLRFNSLIPYPTQFKANTVFSRHRGASLVQNRVRQLPNIKLLTLFSHTRTLTRLTGAGGRRLETSI